MKAPSRKSFLFRAPEKLISQLAGEAQKQGLSLNQLCIRLLSQTGSATQDSVLIESGSAVLDQLLGYIETVLKPLFAEQLVGVVMYGSVARGEARADSDIDILVVLKPEYPLDRDSYTGLSQFQVMGHEVSPLLVQLPGRADHIRGVWLEVAVDGLVLYDPKLQLTQLFSRIRGEIASGRLQRRFTHGVPYWIRTTADALDKST